MAWVRGLQGQAAVLQGCWVDIKAILPGCLKEYDSTAPGQDLRTVKCAQAWPPRLRRCLPVNPFHVATTPRLPSSLLFRTHGLLVRRTRRDALPCVRPCVSWCPGLWRLLCVACDRLEMWQLSLCQTKSGQSHNTQTHSSKNAPYRLDCRASAEEVRALCPPSSPNFKCHAQLNGAAWLTAELLYRDVSSF